MACGPSDLACEIYKAAQMEESERDRSDEVDEVEMGPVQMDGDTEFGQGDGDDSAVDEKGGRMEMT